MSRRITDATKAKVDILLNEYFALGDEINDETKIFALGEAEDDPEELSLLVPFHDALENEFGKKLLPSYPTFHYAGEVYVYLALNEVGLKHI